MAGGEKEIKSHQILAKGVSYVFHEIQFKDGSSVCLRQRRDVSPPENTKYVGETLKRELNNSFGILEKEVLKHGDAYDYDVDAQREETRDMSLSDKLEFSMEKLKVVSQSLYEKTGFAVQWGEDKSSLLKEVEKMRIAEEGYFRKEEAEREIMDVFLPCVPKGDFLSVLFEKRSIMTFPDAKRFQVGKELIVAFSNFANLGYSILFANPIVRRDEGPKPLLSFTDWDMVGPRNIEVEEEQLRNILFELWATLDEPNERFILSHFDETINIRHFVSSYGKNRRQENRMFKRIIQSLFIKNQQEEGKGRRPSVSDLLEVVKSEDVSSLEKKLRNFLRNQPLLLGNNELLKGHLASKYIDVEKYKVRHKLYEYATEHYMNGELKGGGLRNYGDEENPQNSYLMEKIFLEAGCELFYGELFKAQDILEVMKPFERRDDENSLESQVMNDLEDDMRLFGVLGTSFAKMVKERVGMLEEGKPKDE